MREASPPWQRDISKDASGLLSQQNNTVTGAKTCWGVCVCWQGARSNKSHKHSELGWRLRRGGCSEMESERKAEREDERRKRE